MTAKQKYTPVPFTQAHQVTEEEIDFLNHVNNQVYLNWMIEIAWQHSLSVGIDSELQKKLGKIMVVKQHELNYHAAAYLGDQLQIKTWVGEQQGCCSRKRYYEMIRESDQRKIFSGHTVWVCMDLNTRKACEIPNEYVKPYIKIKSEEKTK